MVVEVPGARLHVERAGEGPPLLSVRGSGSALADGIGPATLPLRRSFDVVGWDHRGLGASEDLTHDPLTMADFAQDAVALADALGLERFAVLGISFGGMVAQHLAALVPDRVTALVLCCTSSGGAGGSSYPLHERPSDEVMAGLVDTRPDQAAGVLALLAGRSAPAEPGYARQLEARRHHDAWDLLPRITAPTLVASGAFDGVAPPANGAAIASRVEGAEHRVFAGGHGFLWQDPAAWPAVAGFLSR